MSDMSDMKTCEEDLKVEPKKTCEEDLKSEPNPLRAEVDALTERVTVLESQVRLHVNWNEVFSTYIQPHAHLWMGVAVGLVFRFL